MEETTGNRLCTCRCCWCGSQRPRKTKSIKKWLKKENNSCAMWTMVWLLGQSVALTIEFPSGTVKNPIGMSLASSAWTRKPLNVVVLDINWTTKQKNTLQLTDGLNFLWIKIKTFNTRRCASKLGVRTSERSYNTFISKHDIRIGTRWNRIVSVLWYASNTRSSSWCPWLLKYYNFF